jgi:hypothetical protein
LKKESDALCLLSVKVKAVIIPTGARSTYKTINLENGKRVITPHSCICLYNFGLELIVPPTQAFCYGNPVSYAHIGIINYALAK